MMPPQAPCWDELLAETVGLRRHLAELQREKADLELLIETTTEHSDFVAEDLFQILDSTKTNLLAKITKLTEEVAHLRQKIAELQQEKADLELVLDMNTRLSDLIEEDLLNKVEATLRESERRFRLISETIPVPITVSRLPDQTIVYANEPASNFFGLSIDILKTCTLSDFSDPTTRPLLLEMLVAEGSVNNYELQGKKSDGTSFYGALYSRPLTFNNEPCLLCAVYDMTDRKRAEDEIRTLNEELEERVKKRTQQLEEAHAKIVKLEKEALEIQMAGGFAHEMRNALVGAKLMLESARDQGITLCQKNADLLSELYDLIAQDIDQQSQDQVLDYFGRIEQHEGIIDNVFRMVDQAINRALEVTTLTLEYSKLGRANTGHDLVDLRKVIERILQEHAATFAAHGILIRSTLVADSPLIGYEAHFYSMINNLVLNARDELLEVKDTRTRFIDVILRQEEQHLILTVTDNADGIPESELPRIFEPFFSTKPTTGTGLGLSFVSKLVPMYHGTIRVASEVHKGTTFTLTFPIQQKA